MLAVGLMLMEKRVLWHKAKTALLIMHYTTASAWIFALLLMMIFLLALYPTSFVIGLGFIGVPILIILQVYIALAAKDESVHTFSDEKWYEDREK